MSCHAHVVIQEKARIRREMLAKQGAAAAEGEVSVGHVMVASHARMQMKCGTWHVACLMLCRVLSLLHVMCVHVVCVYVACCMLYACMLLHVACC